MVDNLTKATKEVVRNFVNDANRDAVVKLLLNLDDRYSLSIVKKVLDKLL